MSIRLDLMPDELEIIISKYRRDIEDTEMKIKELVDHKAYLLKRTAELTGRDKKSEFNVIVPEFVITHKPRQTDVFGDVNLAIYNTLRKKVVYIFESTNGEYSTGEMYSKLIEVFPSEGEKKKDTYVQGLSKELGQTHGLYRRNENSRDENGKARFSLILRKK